MKKFKIFTLIVLCFGVVFLTGCGDSTDKDENSKKEEKLHVLKCEMSEDESTESVEIEFNEDETIPTKANLKMSYVAPEGTTEEEMEQVKEYLELFYCSMYDNCKINVTGNTISLSVSGSAEELEIEEKSLEEYKIEFETDGYTCK